MIISQYVCTYMYHIEYEHYTHACITAVLAHVHCTHDTENAKVCFGITVVCTLHTVYLCVYMHVWQIQSKPTWTCTYVHSCKHVHAYLPSAIAWRYIRKCMYTWFTHVRSYNVITILTMHHTHIHTHTHHSPTPVCQSPRPGRGNGRCKTE